MIRAKSRRTSLLLYLVSGTSLVFGSIAYRGDRLTTANLMFALVVLAGGIGYLISKRQPRETVQPPSTHPNQSDGAGSSSGDELGFLWLGIGAVLLLVAWGLPHSGTVGVVGIVLGIVGAAFAALGLYWLQIRT